MRSSVRSRTPWTSVFSARPDDGWHWRVGVPWHPARHHVGATTFSAMAYTLFAVFPAYFGRRLSSRTRGFWRT